MTEYKTTALEPLVFGRAALRSGLARELRIAAGLTQTEVAEAIGVHRVQIWQWENGRRQPTGSRRDRYFAFLYRLSMDERVAS